MKFALALIFAFAVPSAAFSEEVQEAPAAHAPGEKVANNFGDALEKSGDSVQNNSPQGKKVANNFGDALEKTGDGVSKNTPRADKVANNFGDALGEVGKGVSSIFGGKN